MKKICVTLLVLVLVAASAQAAVSINPDSLVVAVSPDNTARVSDGGTDWLASAESATAWRNRSLAEVGGDGWIGIPGVLPYSPYANNSASLAPALFTAVTGFDAYEEVKVWVLFSSNFNLDGTVRKNNWIDAAIDDGSLTTALTAYSFQSGNAVKTGLISRVESALQYEVLAGYLGTATADDNGTIWLLADSRTIAPEVIPGISNGDRSVLHGYAFYEIPEPATMALLGFGALALLRKRK